MQTNNDMPTHLDPAFYDQPVVKKWQKIYYKLWNAEWEKNEKTFEQWIKTQPIENQKQLKVIFNSAKSILNFIMQNITISITFLKSFNKENNVESQKELSIISESELAKHHKTKSMHIMNCGDTANHISAILKVCGRSNIIVSSQPDHGFNIFELNNKFYFFDAWSGGIMKEFTPRIFFKNCDLGGCYNLQDSNRNDHSLQPHLFKKIINDINQSLNTNKDIKAILTNRMNGYFNSFDLDDYSNISRLKEMNSLMEIFNQISDDQKEKQSIQEKVIKQPKYFYMNQRRLNEFLC